MLSFEDKKAIFRSFNLVEKQISNGRVSYVYPESKQRGQVLATQLHPSGNGYVIGKYMLEETIRENEYKVDARGWISIREFSEDALVKVISQAKQSMSGLEDEGPTLSEEKILQDEAAKFSEKKIEISCFQDWVNLNNALLELGLLIWKLTLRRGRLR
ncbi:hypothetical protein ACWM35_20670 [Neobacillus sp. K501]